MSGSGGGITPSHRFLTLDGLMPSTIFDKGDTDMDISEEMEEVRELLYELIKKNFPMGVSSKHLAEKYNEEYVSKGLGRELPPDWLDQVAAAEEFEAQTRGPLTILFVRLSNTSSFKRPPVPLTNVRIISSSNKTCPDPELMKKRKDQYPLQHSDLLSKSSPAVTPKCDVTVVAFESSEVLYVRAVSQEKSFLDIKDDLSRVYAADSSGEYKVQIYEILSGGAYALCDAGGDWFRVVAETLPRNGAVRCFFSDVGVRGLYPIKDLRLLPEPHHSVMQVPALAKRVALNVQESSRGESIDSILKEILFETNAQGSLVPVKVQLTGLSCPPSSDDSVPVPVADLWTMDGQAIREEAQNRFAEGKENNRGVKSTPSISSTRPSSVALPSSVCLFVDQPEIVPLSLDQMPSSTFPANALFAAGPMDISLRQVSLDPMPDYMYSKLSEECLLPESSLDGETPQPGHFYAAMIDGRWERVQCLRASKIDKVAFCVYLIDVGAFHYVRGDSMKRLNTKTPFRKMLMFKCKLAGIAPFGGVDVWSREAHEAVREFFEAAMGEPVQVTPLANGWSEWNQLNAPRVPVTDARVACCGRDLSDWLIACGLAMPSPIANKKSGSK